MLQAESVPEIGDLKSEIANQGFKMNGPGFFGMEMIIFPVDLHFPLPAPALYSSSCTTPGINWNACLLRKFYSRAEKQPPRSKCAWGQTLNFAIRAFLATPVKCAPVEYLLVLLTFVNLTENLGTSYNLQVNKNFKFLKSFKIN